MPGLIDEIPGLAALAAMQPAVAMTVRGAQELRVKESDRITMLARGFGNLGITVDEYPDGFTIHGGPPAGGEADAADDHRLAMAFAIAGSRARGAVHDHRRRRGRGLVPGILRRARADRARPVTPVDKIYLVGLHGRRQDDGRAGCCAARLGWRAEDIDELIEARERLTVADIFARHGEAVFPRRRTRDPLRLLLPLRHTVVATGGGTFMDPENQQAIKLDGTSVWLDVPLETVDRAAAARRPPAAVRRPGPDGAAVRDRARPPTPAPTCASTPPGRPRRSPSGFSTRCRSVG